MSDTQAAPEEPEVDGFAVAETPNAGNEAGVMSAAQRKRARDIEDADVLKMILGTAAGRRWYANLQQNVCGLYNPAGALDVQGLAYLAGARAVGLFLHNEALHKAKALYMVLQNESLT